MFRYVIIGLFLSFSLVPFARAEESTLEDRVDSFVNSMTLRQKVGQLFIFGFSGKSLNENLKHKITTYEPGAIIIFKHNISNPVQLYSMNHSAQRLSLKSVGLPLLIMVDQEGGVVSRIRTRPSAPSALALGFTQNPALAEKTGLVTGRILRLLGFNVNLAPVVDISDPNKINFIGNRSFGGNPQQVHIMSTHFSSGLARAGVVPTLKHYPGHGGIIRDTHKAFAVKNSTLEELKHKDLIPFSEYNEDRYPSAVMVAHIAYTKVDPSGLPATFSPYMVTKILKGDLDFRGLIITDDIEMYGATVYKSIGERAIRAIEAGNDMVMVAWTRHRQREAFAALLKAVKSGRVSESRLDESVRKIVTTKLKLNYNPRQYENPKYLKKELSNNIRELKNVANVVTQRNLDRAFYLEPRLKGVLDISTPIYMFAADYKFYKSFAKAVPNKVTYYPLSRRRHPPVEYVLNKHKSGVGLYYVTGTGTARLLHRVNNALKSRIIVVNATNPGMIVDRKLFKGVIDINSRNFNSGSWIASYLQGIRPEQRVPASKNVSQRFRPTIQKANKKPIVKENYRSSERTQKAHYQ